MLRSPLDESPIPEQPAPWRPARAHANAESLAPEQISRSEYVAGRLYAELRTAMQSLPPAHQAARAMAKHLGVDPNITQRVARAIHGDGGLEGGLDFLLRVPGPDTLRRFLRAVQRRADGGFSAEVGLAAVKDFDRLTHDLAGSQAKLMARIRASQARRDGSTTTTNPAELERCRRRIYQSVAETMRLSVDACMFLDIVKPIGDDGRFVDLVTLRAAVGQQVHEGAMPLVSGARLFESEATAAQSESSYGDLTRDFTAVGRPRTLVPEFTSTPSPRLVGRCDGTRLLEIVEPPHPLGLKFDMTAGHRISPLPNPVGTDDPHVSLGVRVRIPTRMLVYTGYLHKALASACTPSIASYFWTPEAAASPWSAWYDRLPAHGALELLGPGLDRASSSAWPRMRDLTAFAFRKLGWDPGDFMGYRLIVSYPYWGAGYHLLLDFK